MLKHEQTDPPAVSPTIPLSASNAAEARVTPDELNAALKALEDQQSSTVAIGSVVDELRLNATSEQIWEQVQKQREQQPQAPKAVFAPTNAPARRRLRTWRDIKGWVWVLFWCTGGLGLFSGLNSLEIGQTIVVNGDHSVQTLQAEGKRVIINGDGNIVHIQGRASGTVVNGNNDKIVPDFDQDIQTNGDNDTIYPPSPAQSDQLKELEKLKALEDHHLK